MGATLDFCDAAEFTSRRSIVQIAHRRRQFVKCLAQQPRVERSRRV
jgi:hypothetical protein